MTIKDLKNDQFFLIAGPCVVESREICFEIAASLTESARKLGINYVFKASYRKANRSKIDSYTGIGDEKALNILAEIKQEFNVPVLTDIHSVAEAEKASSYVDILQIPAFLCRQTDLLVAAARTDKIVNIKKGQFVAPGSMHFAVEKVLSTGNKNILITERGTMFGYNDLIVDYRGIVEMQKTGFPVILDITHSLQQPNQDSGVSGGHPDMIETIARAGIAVNVDGIFLETHPNPENALSDGANMIKLKHVDSLLVKLSKIKSTINEFTVIK